MAARKGEPLESVLALLPNGKVVTVSAAQAERCRYRLLSEAPEEPAVSPEPTAADIRAWAKENNLAVPAKGRIPADVVEAYKNAH